MRRANKRTRTLLHYEHFLEPGTGTDAAPKARSPLQAFGYSGSLCTESHTVLKGSDPESAHEAVAVRRNAGRDTIKGRSHVAAPDINR